MLTRDQVNVFQWLLYIKIWWALVGKLSDFGTLFWHNTIKRLPIPGLDSGSIPLWKILLKAELNFTHSYLKLELQNFF